MRKLSVFLFFAALVFNISCAGIEKKNGAELPVIGAGDAKSAELQSRIKEINENKPSSISSDVTVDGDNRGKKFRFEGSFVYDSKGLAKLSLVDYIFKGPVLDFYRVMNNLYFHYSSERKIYADKYDKIVFSNYSGFPLDFDFVYTLFTGGIPLIKNITSVKSLGEGSGDSFHLIAESGEYFQNIYFKKDMPERILVIHKMSREKIEIYLQAHRVKDKSYFFHRIRIVVPGADSSFNINFAGTRMNLPVRIDPFRPESVRGAEIIRVN
jgi:hypothetical protein